MIQFVLYLMFALFGIAISTYSLIVGETVQWWELLSLILCSFMLGLLSALWRDAWSTFKAEQGG